MAVTNEAVLHEREQSPSNWVPQTEEDRVAIREQLKRILASSHFTTSKRYPALLRYVVEESLQGNADQLKERSLGIAVFHRDPMYDTNTDPVVRFTAGEVRKRLAQYYYDPNRSREIHIELPQGSYAPEFRIPNGTDPEEPLPLVSPSESLLMSEPQVDALQSAPESVVLHPKRMWGEHKKQLLSLLIGMGLGAIAIQMHPWSRPTASDQFWGPFLSSHNPVVLCVGQLFTEQARMKPNPARTQVGQVFAPELDTAPNGVPNTSTAPSKILPNVVRPREIPVFALANMVTSASVVAALQSKDRAYSIRGESDTTFSDLSAGPVVLIGAYDNDWTIRLNDRLRFHFDKDADTNQQWIADRQKPAERIGQRTIATPAPEDYAIISRVYDPTTEQMAIALAGIGPHGTLGRRIHR